MVSKTSQKITRESNRKKKTKIDNTVNWYMINLAWGIFIIILLRFVESGYSSADMVLQMPVLMKSLAGVFGAVAIGLFVCGGLDVWSKKSRFIGYGVFAIVLALGSLWIGFFPQIRNLFVDINPALSDIDSRWWISRGLIILTAIYLVVSLLFTAVKIALIEKGKKF